VYSQDNKQYILETKQKAKQTKTKIHEKTKVQENTISVCHIALN
jgi:hypothetical protein